MDFRAVFSDSDSAPIPACPICGGKMEPVYNRNHQTVVVCADCHAGLTIPAASWEVARIKRDSGVRTAPHPERRKNVRPVD